MRLTIFILIQTKDFSLQFAACSHIFGDSYVYYYQLIRLLSQCKRQIGKKKREICSSHSLNCTHVAEGVTDSQRKTSVREAISLMKYHHSPHFLVWRNIFSGSLIFEFFPKNKILEIDSDVLVSDRFFKRCFVDLQRKKKKSYSSFNHLIDHTVRNRTDK